VPALSPLASATQDLADRARITGSPRAEAEGEMMDGRMQRQAVGGHKGAHRKVINLGSFSGSSHTEGRRGKRGRTP